MATTDYNLFTQSANQQYIYYDSPTYPHYSQQNWQPQQPTQTPEYYTTDYYTTIDWSNLTISCSQQVRLDTVMELIKGIEQAPVSDILGLMGELTICK